MEKITVDRGLSVAGKIHGVNPALLIDKILREKIQDSAYWHITASRLTFYDILQECAANVHIVGTYLNKGKTKVTKFIALLFRLLQLEKIDAEVVTYLITGDHGYKYITLLFMVYARLTWEDSTVVWETLETRMSDYKRIRKVVEGGVIQVSFIDVLADELLMLDRFMDLALPRLVNRWVLEERGLPERESTVMDEFEQELEELEED